MGRAGRNCKHGTSCVASPQDNRNWGAVLKANSTRKAHAAGKRTRRNTEPESAESPRLFVCLKCAQCFPDNHRASKHSMKTKHYVIATVTGEHSLAAHCVKCEKQNGDGDLVPVDTPATKSLFNAILSRPSPQEFTGIEGNVAETRVTRSSTRGKTKKKSLFQEDEESDSDLELAADLGPELVPLRRKGNKIKTNSLQRKVKKSSVPKAFPPSNGLRNPNNYCYLNVIIQSFARTGVVKQSLINATQCEGAYERFEQIDNCVLTKLLMLLESLKPNPSRLKAVGERWLTIPKVVSSQPVLKAIGGHYSRFLATKHEQQDAYELLCVLLDLAHEQHKEAELPTGDLDDVFSFRVRQVAQCNSCDVVLQQHVVKTTSLSLQLSDLVKSRPNTAEGEDVSKPAAVEVAVDSAWASEPEWPIECRQVMDCMISDIERFHRILPSPAQRKEEALTLEDCISRFCTVQLPEWQQGDRLPDPCPVCEAQEGLRVATVPSTFPRVLVMHFSRFAASFRRGVVRLSKLATMIRLDPELEVAHWNKLGSAGCQASGSSGLKYPRYELSSVVLHKGSLERGGHYTVIVRGSDTSDKEKWFSYSDDSVRQVTADHALNNQAYIAFYTRIDDAEISEDLTVGDSVQNNIGNHEGQLDDHRGDDVNEEQINDYCGDHVRDEGQINDHCGDDVREEGQVKDCGDDGNEEGQVNIDGDDVKEG